MFQHARTSFDDGLEWMFGSRDSTPAATPDTSPEVAEKEEGSSHAEPVCDEGAVALRRRRRPAGGRMLPPSPGPDDPKGCGQDGETLDWMFGSPPSSASTSPALSSDSGGDASEAAASESPGLSDAHNKKGALKLTATPSTTGKSAPCRKPPAAKRYRRAATQSPPDVRTCTKGGAATSTAKAASTAVEFRSSLRSTAAPLSTPVESLTRVQPKAATVAQPPTKPATAAVDSATAVPSTATTTATATATAAATAVEEPTEEASGSADTDAEPRVEPLATRKTTASAKKPVQTAKVSTEEGEEKNSIITSYNQYRKVKGAGRQPTVVAPEWLAYKAKHADKVRWDSHAGRRMTT